MINIIMGKKIKPAKQNGKPASKQGKGKRWKKGHSCVTNPDVKKHRSMAKSRFFNKSNANSNLTEDALAQHNATEADGVMRTSESEGDALTVNTWATNWTECTNATFSKVLRLSTTGSELHKEILAVLAAITEVIKTQGGKQTETEYFAALMSTLEAVDGDLSLAASAYLLSLVMKRVPVAVMKSRFSDIAKTLVNLLSTHINSEQQALLKSLIVCLSHLLRTQDLATWSDASTMNVFQAILSLTVSHRPKVRRAAQHAVRSILCGSEFMTKDGGPSVHPAASVTAKYSLLQIKQSADSDSVTLYVLGLLQQVIHVFPESSVKQTCEAMLRLLTLANMLVTSVVMKTFHSLFTAKTSTLSADLNARIITALYDFKPSDTDAQPMSGWLAVMEQAHCTLTGLDPALCLSHLPRLFSVTMKCLSGGNTQVTQLAADTIVCLLKTCVGPHMDMVSKQVSVDVSSSAIVRMFRFVENGLSYQYCASWNHVLIILALFFKLAGKLCQTSMKKCLVSLASLRDSDRFEHIVLLDKAVGAAISAMGPRIVLEAVPLNITGENDDYSFRHSWLLPVMRDSIEETELAFYTSYFLPLAAKLKTKSVEFVESGRTVEGRTYDALHNQIWSLLPGFCTRPTDLAQSFKGVARILGECITHKPDIRMQVMASLRKLITQNLSHDVNRRELARFDRNFLPLLFNLFTSPDAEKTLESSRLAVLETIKCYLQIANVELVNIWFDKCLEKVKIKDTDINSRHALMDLLIAMIPYVGSDKLSTLLPYVLSILESSDKTMQKKAYRILEELCAGKSADCRMFVSGHIESLQSHLLKSLSASSPSSKAPRLRCLLHIIKNLDSGHTGLVSAILPEAILCTKAAAESARVAAYNLILEMIRAQFRWRPDRQQTDVVSDSIQMLMAGLAGSPHMVSCTVLALTRTLFEHKALVSSAMMKVLVDHTCLLLQSKAREVVQSALSLLKVLLSAFDKMSLAQFMSHILASLVTMTEDNRHHFRFKAKEIFAKLIRKFGYADIVRLVPESYHKQLHNIHKTQERSKRSKQADSETSEVTETATTRHQGESMEDILRDSDSEVDTVQDEAPNKSRKRGAKQNAAWLKENEEDIVDFLDPSVSTKVTATRPERETASKNKKIPFKMAPDGRMIIQEDTDDKGKPAPKDDVDELLDALKQQKINRKRKILMDVDSDEDDMQSSAMKYKAGGRGIHRPTSGGNAPQQVGREFKAKKAGGDIKKTGKMDPYAYVPLQHKFLNKRKKAKAAGQFKNFVRSARTGADKGQKQRHKQKKKSHTN